MNLTKFYSKDFLKVSLGVLFFKAILEIMYVIYICPKHNNRGFVYDPSVLSISLSWILTLVIIPFMWNYYKNEHSSSKITTLWLLITFIPSTTIFGFINADLLLWESFLIYWVVLLVSILILQKINFPQLGRKIAPYRTSIFLGLAFFFSTVVLFVSGYYFKFRLSFDIEHVTEMRAQFKEVEMPTILHYLLPISSTILPILSVYYLVNKKYLLGIGLILILLLDFSIAGHRIIMVKLVLCIFGYLAYNFFQARYFVWYFSGIIVLSLFIYFSLDQTILSALVRRGFYIPGILNFEYFQFFTNHLPDFYAQGIIGSLTGMESQYDQSISMVIGGQFIGEGSGNHANNGLYSDAIANLGVQWIFIHAMVVALYLKIFDWAAHKIDRKYEFLPVFIVAQTLISSMITTSLITHGLFALLFIVLLLPKKETV